MLNTKNPVGRPAIHIKPEVLSQLRIDAGLTQVALGKAVYALAKKRWESTGSLQSTVYRWESSGTLDVTLAAHLATVLKTTVPILTGEHPASAPSRIDELKEILSTRAQDQSHLKLQEALRQLREQGYEKPVPALADDLSRFIEVAQLSQSSQAFEHITALTGLGRSELERPSSHSGLWLMIGSGHGPAFREIVTGIDSLRYKLEDEWKEASNSFGLRDCSIEFSEEKPWFKVRWTASGLVGFSRTIRFVRCQPNSKGLSWVAPSEWDKFHLESFAPSAQPYFDVVTGFDARPVPAALKDLRVRIERNYSPREYEANPSRGYSETLALHSGELPEYADQIVNDYASVANISFMAIQYLCRDLWDAIEPHLSDWPLKYWSIQAGSSQFSLVLGEIPIREWRSLDNMPPFGHRFSVSLVERQTDGSYHTAPWKTALVELICERLNRKLQEART